LFAEALTGEALLVQKYLPKPGVYVQYKLRNEGLMANTILIIKNSERLEFMRTGREVK
jgi:hypothetical protein